MASAADNYTLALGDDIFCGVLCTPHMCMCLAPANNHDNLARGSRRMGASTNGGEHPRFAHNGPTTLRAQHPYNTREAS